jgi:hypothetical protein
MTPREVREPWSRFCHVSEDSGGGFSPLPKESFAEPNVHFQLTTSSARAAFFASTHYTNNNRSQITDR